MRCLALLAIWLVAVQHLAACTTSLSLRPDVLDVAVVGRKYRQEISIIDSKTPVGSVSIAKGGLPPGLNLSFDEGSDSFEIEGTPSASGKFEFQVTIWCYGTNFPGQSLDKTMVIKVRQPKSGRQ